MHLAEVGGPNGLGAGTHGAYLSERELRLVTDATAWAQHLADADGYFAVAVGFKKRRPAFRLAGVCEARRDAAVAEIARRYTGDEGQASGFLDRICDGPRAPAKRTGTDG